MKTLTTAAVVLLCWAMVVVTGVLLVLWWVQPAQADAPVRHEYMPCDGSDTDTSCVWHLPSMGEGDGFSWSFFVGRDGKVYRLPDHIALSLLSS